MSCEASLANPSRIASSVIEDIREGFANLKEQEQYQPLYLAGLSRAIGDWLLGMNATRLYTLKYGNNSYGRGQVLSIGRVQTPTLALIVQRQKEIDNFKPEPYWVLATVYRETQFTATKGKFTSKEEGEKAFSTIEEKPFTITSVAKKKGAEQPKQLYDLTSLQVDCNRKFGFSTFYRGIQSWAITVYFSYFAWYGKWRCSTYIHASPHFKFPVGVFFLLCPCGYGNT